MKTRLLFVIPIIALAAVLGVQAQEKAKEEMTELGAKMDKMRIAFSAINRQIDDATKNPDTLAKLAELRTNAEAAVNLVPARKAEVPAAEQAKFVADYQAKMKSFLADVAKVEAALKAGNNAEAKTIIATLKQTQKEGHNAFKQQKKKAP